jgi:hypothetical protein
VEFSAVTQQENANMSHFSSLTMTACLASCLAAAVPSWAAAQDVQTQTTTTSEGAQPAQPATVQVQTAPAPAPAPAAAPPRSTTSTTYVKSDSDRPYVDTVEERVLPNRSMLSTGGTMFLLSYLPSVVVAASADWEDDNTLYAPFIGPWMYLARGDDLNAGGRALLAADGILQDLGGLMMVGSLFIPERKERRGILFGHNDKLHLSPRASRYTAATNGADGYAVSLAARGRF